MNEFLADLYNTRESIGAPRNDSDVEKLAEAQILDEALQAEGIDIDKLPGDTILKLAHQLLGDDSALVKSAQAEAYEGKETPEEEAKEEEAKEEKEEKKEASETFEEKFAQADFLGRTMAHAFWNEKVELEKNAAGAREFLGKGLTKAREFAGKAGEAVKGYHEGAVRNIRKGIEGKGYPEGLHMTVGQRAKAIGKGVAKFTPHAAATVGVEEAARRGLKKEKKASAIDVLAEKRAMEWAEAHGLIQNEPTDEMKLATAVDQRAAEMLAEAGIDVNAVEAASQK